MDQFRTFLDMGGYAAFVWPAYGLTAAVMVGFVITSLRRLRRRQRRLAEMEASRAGKE